MKLKLVAAVFAAAFVAGVAFVSLASRSDAASAAPGDVTVTVTHWTTNAAGAVSGTTGGAVGAGTVTGQYLAYSPGPPITSTVILELKGSAQSMTITIETRDTAVTGKVTAGWLNGQSFTGSYTGQTPCSQSNDGNCYTFAFVVNDPSAATAPGGGGGSSAPPAVGTGLAPSNESSPLVFYGIALIAAGAAGFVATTLRRVRR